MGARKISKDKNIFLHFVNNQINFAQISNEIIYFIQIRVIQNDGNIYFKKVWVKISILKLSTPNQMLDPLSSCIAVFVTCELWNLIDI